MGVFIALESKSKCIVYSDKKLDGIYYLAADYNMDGKISIFDIVKINNVIVGGN